MSKTKKEKNENDAVENKNQKFKRIANFRLKKLLYEIQRITRMPSQPTYDIYDVDAQKILEKLTPEFETLINLYTNIAENKNIKTTKTTEQEDII